MLLIPIPLRTRTRRVVATIIFLGLVAAGYVFVATRAPGRQRPHGVWQWASTVFVVAIGLAIFRWAVQAPRRMMEGEPMPSIRPNADRDRDRATDDR